MAVSSPCYCTRDEVMLALDFHPTQRSISLVDNAIQAAANDIYGILHRRFYPEDGIKYFDWPNFQGAYPWRIWFEQYDLIVATLVTTGGVTIPLDDIFFEPVDKEANEPYVYMELDRSTNAAFGSGPTPQHDVAITGTWGYTAQAAPAGALSADAADDDTTITVTDGSRAGVGDVLLIGSERLLVTDRAMVSTGVSFTGPATAQANDNLVAVPDVTVFSPGEVLLLDAERMYISDTTGGALVVKRAWEGTILTAHTSGTIYANRQLSAARGALGTTAAPHSSAAAVSRHVPPPLITELAVALAENTVLQKTSGYARTVGTGDTTRNASGAGLADLQARACARYGRKSRVRVV